MKTFIKDNWLQSQINICEETCNTCGSEESITISKKDILKLIKILKKLDYKGIPKRHYYNKEYIIREDEKWKLKYLISMLE